MPSFLSGRYPAVKVRKKLYVTSKQVALVREKYRLSAREAEIAEQIVRGKTVVRIAEELVISENTVRMHSKRIYSKLDVHKKQDLIDLVESARP